MSDETRTLEQVYRSAVRGLYARIRSNYDYIYQRFGDDGIKMIADMSREYGLGIAQRAKNGLKDNDLTAVGDYLLRIFDTVDRGSGYMHLIEKNNSRVIIGFDRCPLGIDNPDMCLAHTCMEKAVVEELNPDLRYRIGKSIAAGDDYCEHIVEVKKQ